MEDQVCPTCKGGLDPLEIVPKKGDHATKNGNYTCDNCSRARQKLKKEKHKAHRQARIDDIGLQTKRQVKNYPLDRLTSGNEKFLNHIQRNGDESFLRSRKYDKMVREIEDRYSFQVELINPDWRELSDDALTGVLVYLRDFRPGQEQDPLYYFSG